MIAYGDMKIVTAPSDLDVSIEPFLYTPGLSGIHKERYSTLPSKGMKDTNLILLM